MTAKRKGVPDKPRNDGTSWKMESRARENSSVGNDSNMSIVRESTESAAPR